MALITAQSLSLAFGHVALLDHVDFAIEPSERVALIGRNGGGKSSLMKILAGLERPDAGQLQMRQGLRTAYVAQEPLFDANHSVFEVVSQGAADAKAWRDEYEALAATGEHMDQLAELQARIDWVDGWAWEQRVDEAIQRLNLPRDATIASLSGGVQKRVALARAAVVAPDVLLLDEPTNHLDMDGIAWLQTMLTERFKGSIMFVTHDRAFLDAVATRVVELDRGILRSYPGNYADYETQKADELHAEALASARHDKLLGQEEVWVRQGVEARRTRSVGRVKRLEALRAQRAARRDQVGDVRLRIDDGLASGRLVVELDDVSKSYGERVVVSHFSATILRGDKVGLIGPNGAGKTTLLKLMLGELAPDSGRVRVGARLQVAYFDQMRATLDLEATIADTINDKSDWVEIGGQRQHVLSYMSDFLFSPARARSPVKTLSGGERNRLLLAKLFAKPANVLVLDEPTNDLDIDTLELLESLLQTYKGTVFLVSHDRRFLDNVVTSTIVAEGAPSMGGGPGDEGRWREYEGGVSDWLQQSQRSLGLAGASAGASSNASPSSTPAQAAPSLDPAANPSPSATQASSASESTKPARRKLSYKDQRELDALPARIEALEAEQAALQATMGDANFYALESPTAVAQAHARVQAIDEELMRCLERWEALGS